jgi:PAS domain S-box-containing protein
LPSSWQRAIDDAPCRVIDDGVELRARRTPRGILLVARETEADDSTRDARRFRALMESLPMLVGVYDERGRLLDINAAAERMMGHTSAELRGVSWLDFVPEDHRYKLGDEPGGVEQIEHAVQTPIGRRIVAWTNVPVREGGRVVERVGFGADVTHARDREAVLEKSLADNEALLRELHHRVRNSLQMVTSLVSLRLGDVTDPAVRATVEDVRARVHAMAMLHEHLYRARSSGHIDSRAFLEGLVRALERSFVRPEIQVSTALDSVQFDVEQAVAFGTCLLELLGNAYRHGLPPGRPGCVRVELHVDAGEACLAIEDDGVGRDPARDATGGMGITIVESLVRSRGGRLVWAEQTRGVRVEVCSPWST